jgi:tRNA-dihydrouridine synthase
LSVFGALKGRGLELIDISGGTYFPGAPSNSDLASGGPYFVDFAAAARNRSTVPLMATGGFKQLDEVEVEISKGAVDLVGSARALVLDPALASTWNHGGPGPTFPRFSTTPPGGVTAWFTMRLTDIGEDRENVEVPDVLEALKRYEARDNARFQYWNEMFSWSRQPNRTCARGGEPSRNHLSALVFCT